MEQTSGNTPGDKSKSKAPPLVPEANSSFNSDGKDTENKESISSHTTPSVSAEEKPKYALQGKPFIQHLKECENLSPDDSRKDMFSKDTRLSKKADATTKCQKLAPGECIEQSETIGRHLHTPCTATCAPETNMQSVFETLSKMGLDCCNSVPFLKTGPIHLKEQRKDLSQNDSKKDVYLEDTIHSKQANATAKCQKLASEECNEQPERIEQRLQLNTPCTATCVHHTNMQPILETLSKMGPDHCKSASLSTTETDTKNMEELPRHDYAVEGGSGSGPWSDCSEPHGKTTDRLKSVDTVVPSSSHQR